MIPDFKKYEAAAEIIREWIGGGMHERINPNSPPPMPAVVKRAYADLETFNNALFPLLSAMVSIGLIDLFTGFPEHGSKGEGVFGIDGVCIWGPRLRMLTKQGKAEVLAARAVKLVDGKGKEIRTDNVVQA